MDERKQLFIFFRKKGFYPLELVKSAVEENAKLNPGTLRVEDAAGTVVWRADDEAQG